MIDCELNTPITDRRTMDLIILAAILLLIAVFFLLRRRSAKPCKWKKAEKPKGSLQEYRCGQCGATAYTNTSRPPKECKSGLKGGL